jgi:hypothetical protein
LAESWFKRVSGIGDLLFVSGMVYRALDGVSIAGSNEYEKAKIIYGKIHYLVEAAGRSDVGRRERQTA